MSEAQLFITAFSTAEGEVLRWWHYVDNMLVAKGYDADPLLAAGLKLPSVEQEQVFYIALMPSTLSVVRWHEPLEDLTDQQALSAARIAAQENSLDLENLHIAAVLDSDGQAATASIGKDVMAAGLLRLEALGIDPDAVVPSGWLVAPQDDGIVEADFGFETLLRGAQFIAPNEPALRTQLVGDNSVTVLSETAVDRLLANAADNSGLNLRSGPFTKKVAKYMSADQKRILVWLAAAVIFISLLIPGIELMKYYWAASEAEAAALAAAEPVIGPAETVDAAEKMLNDRLISENRGNIAFSVPASALFSALQQSQTVSIDRISYRRDGTVSTTLSAVRNEDINPVLIAIQKSGFVITATPRTDATGSAKADVTVRAP